VLRRFRQAVWTRVSDEQIAELLASDPERGWKAFIESHTPTLLALIERAGVVDRDEAMEVYTRVCTRLSNDGYAALRGRDPAAGSLAGWLAVVVRRAAVDYVRSQIGRRRMFGAVRELDRTHQRVFELYYWDGRPLAEVTEVLRAETTEDVTLDSVLDRLETVDRVLTDRHRAELLSLVARSRAPVPLEAGDGETPALEPAAEMPDPEAALRIRETEAHLQGALAALPAEDAAIVTLKYGEGLTRPQIQRLLRLPELTEHRVRTIAATLRALLTSATLSAAGVPDHAQRSTNV
jgi:DNA-directed RNA polymerase specialized sigma24 family protein